MIKESSIDTFIKEPHRFGHYLGYEDLIDLHSEWINDAWLNKDIKAMQAHRNSYKTTSILIVGVIWHTLFFEPKSTNLFIRKSGTEAVRIGMAIKNHYESKRVEILAEHIYGVKSLITKHWSSSSMTLSIKDKITIEGSVDTIGMGGAITGSHYDYIFPDDIITLKDKISKAEREYTKEYIRELRTNIVKEEGHIFFSGTPWQKDDAWTILPEPKKYPIGTVQIKGFTGEELEEKKAELRETTTSSLYAINYELRHIASDSMIFANPVYKKWPEDLAPFAWIDPAYSGKNTTALCLIGKKQKQWYGRGWVFIQNIVDIYVKLIDILKAYNAGTLYIESNADKGLSVKDLRQLYPSVIPVWEGMNKHLKIISYGRQHWKEIAWAKDCQPEFLNQLLDYEEGEEPDDAPDAFASLLRELGFSGHKNLSHSVPDFAVSL